MICSSNKVKIDKKADSMKKKTDEARRKFNLPDTEAVILDYHASIWKSIVYVQGRMWITQNYMGFYAPVPETTEIISFRKVINIEKEKSALVFASAISVTIEGGNKLFFFC